MRQHSTIPRQYARPQVCLHKVETWRPSLWPLPSQFCVLLKSDAPAAGNLRECLNDIAAFISRFAPTNAGIAAVEQYDLRLP